MISLGKLIEIDKFIHFKLKIVLLLLVIIVKTLSHERLIYNNDIKGTFQRKF
jgi:hypothetical protein